MKEHTDDGGDNDVNDDEEHNNNTLSRAMMMAATAITAPPPPQQQQQQQQRDKPTSHQNDNTCSSTAAIGLFLFSFCTVSLSSGLVYGWPSLRRQLVNVEQSTLSEDRLGLIITTGAWSTQSLRFFFGLARDRSWGGTARTAVVSLVCCAAGCFGLANSHNNNATALTISMFLVGMGSGTQLCLQPVAGLFPVHSQGTLIASLSGAFQIAGLVFVALTSATTNRRAAFDGFAGVLLCLAVIGYAILPIQKFVPREKQRATKEEAEAADRAGEDNVLNEACYDSNKEADDKPEANQNEADMENDNQVEQDGVQQGETSISTYPHEEEEEEDSVLASLRSAEYILLLLWFTIQLIPMQYYVATIGYQLEQKGDNDGMYTRIFSIVYAAAAPVAPLCGKVADMFGLGIAQACSTILASFSLFLLSSNAISLNSHTIGMVAYGLGRMFVFGNYFTNLGKRFGYHNYGTLSGLGLLLSGIVSLIQYPMIATATNGGGGGGAMWVNIASGIAMVASLPYCVWLALREHRERQLQQSCRSGGV